MTLKSRSTAGPVFQGYYNGNAISYYRQQMAGSSESIETFSHNLSLLGKVDCGGPMLLTRNRYLYTPNTVTTSQQGYQGSQLPIAGIPVIFEHPDVSTTLDMYSKGATAISRTIPTAPVFSAVTAMRELRADGFPSAPGVQSWRDRTLRARNAGGEYLNVEFGWLPLVSDMRNFAKSVKSHHAILSDLRAGSSKNTRVGYHFPSSDSFSSTQGSAFVHWPTDTGYSTIVSANYTARQTQETWFKGCFTYLLPESDTSIGKAQLYVEYADKLLGIKPTPENIWNSSPWSWALDWFANTGDVLANISALGQNSLALKYGYIMSSCSTETTVNTVSEATAFGGFTAGSVTHLQEWKKRLPANPYGFGVTGDSLSNTQKAIVAALGLTRGHHGR